MITTASEPMPQHAQALQSSITGRLLRSFWLVVGNVVVYASFVAIVLTSARLPGPLDAVVWTTVGLMLVARWLDITRFAGRTSQGEATTPSDWPRYAATLTGAALLGELVAHYLGGSLLQ